MIKETTKKTKNITLKAIFDSKKNNKKMIKIQNHITEFLSENKALIYLGNKKNFNLQELKKVAQIIKNLKRDFQIDIPTFITRKIKEALIVREITEAYILEKGDLFNLKTSQKSKENDLYLFGLTKKGKEQFLISKNETKIRNWTRSFQTMPPNILNSVKYANELKKEFQKIKNVNVKILDKKEIEDLKMGLLIAVNRGSEYEPKIVVVEYKGRPNSKEKTVYIGKGIMFDSGGYSLKPSNFIRGMKYDMSGTAIVAGAMRLIANNKPKANISIVMPLTDNMIGKKAQTVDAVWTSMNGKTVEINNTDAEGRLILADAITYSIRNLKATRIIDVATLTGAMKHALGSAYTGIWTTSDKDWELMDFSAKAKGEMIWKMPFNDAFIEGMKKSKIADLFNTNYSNFGGGSAAAATWLKEFTENVPFIHFDVAGTADINGNPSGVLVKTLAEFANKI